MKEKLINYIQENFVSDSITINSSEDLLTTGIVDSMAIMRLISFIEEAKDIQIPPEDLIIENFISVEAIIQYLDNNH